MGNEEINNFINDFIGDEGKMNNKFFKGFEASENNRFLIFRKSGRPTIAFDNEQKEVDIGGIIISKEEVKAIYYQCLMNRWFIKKGSETGYEPKHDWRNASK